LKEIEGTARKLPTLTLKPLRENKDEWPTCWSTFISPIHKNRNLTIKAKFQYLVSSLKGNTFRKILHLDINEINYIDAIGSLRQEFDNPQEVAKTLMANMFRNLPKLINKSHKKLSDVTATVRQTYNAIDKVGEQFKHRDAWIAYIIQARFNNRMQNMHFNDVEEEF
jgi:Protein of unknown function (DUF1759)